MHIFISACHSTNTAEQNQQALVRLARYIVQELGVPFDVAVGVYQEEGQQLSTEITYIVNVPSADGMSARHIEECARDWAEMAHADFEQDCVGVLHNGEFYLAWPGDTLIYMGQFKRFDSQPVGIPCTKWEGQWYAAVKETT